MDHNYYVYILASRKNGTIYIGITNNLEKRMYQHKNNLTKGFTSKYKVYLLVYYEHIIDVNVAINRESQLKNWKRQWKIALIEKNNPGWKDLSADWGMDSGSSPE